jgi:hypothetical protein
LLATPANERHAFPTLAAAMIVAAGGLGVIYLGTDLPAADIVLAARKSEADVVLLSLSSVPNSEVLDDLDYHRPQGAPDGRSLARRLSSTAPGPGHRGISLAGAAGFLRAGTPTGGAGSKVLAMAKAIQTGAGIVMDGGGDAGVMKRGFFHRRVVAPIVALLTQGITPEKIALSLAFGIVLGIFPVLGSTTVLCAVAA